MKKDIITLGKLTVNWLIRRIAYPLNVSHIDLIVDETNKQYINKISSVFIGLLKNKSFSKTGTVNVIKHSYAFLIPLSNSTNHKKSPYHAYVTLTVLQTNC